MTQYLVTIKNTVTSQMIIESPHASQVENLAKGGLGRHIRDTESTFVSVDKIEPIVNTIARIEAVGWQWVCPSCNHANNETAAVTVSTCNRCGVRSELK